MAYVTLAEAKEYLSITSNDDDSLLNSLIASVEAYVDSKTGRHWGSKITVTDETYDYKPILWLNNTDITKVTKVKFGHEQTGTLQTLDANSYRWNENGRLVLGYQYGHVPDQHDFDYVHVSYTYNAGEVPDDLKLTVKEILSVFYNKAKAGGGEISQERIGDLEVRYRSITDSLSHRPDLLDTINRHRRRRV